MQLGRAGVAHGIENPFAQGEIEFAFNDRRQILCANGALKIELKAGTGAKYIQFLLEASLQRAGLKLFRILIFRQQIADFSDRFVDVFLDQAQFFFESAAIVEKLAPGAFGA